MTTTEVLSFHDISFITLESELDSKPIKFFIGGGEMESFFLNFRNLDDVESEVIPVIDHYLNGNLFAIDNDLTVEGSDYIEVTTLGVRFINKVTLVEDQLVPLDQFKTIAQA